MKTAAGILQRAHGFSLVELLMYLVLLSAISIMAFTTYHRAASQSYALKQQTRELAAVLRVGERWRQDIREATRPPEWIENDRLPAPVLRLVLKTETIEYIFQNEKFFRRNSEGAKELVLSNVRASRMIDDPRGEVPSVRWEVELKSRKEHRQTKLLFTFQAVPALP